MGSPCAIQLYTSTRKKAKQAANKAMADVQRLEAIYSRYRKTSFLSEINRVATMGGSITVDTETAGLLDYAATCYRESDGLFDITSGILRQAWDFKSGNLPSEEMVQSLLKKVGWDKLCWQSPVLEFPVPGMEIDFGGVVKEYAVDRAAALCWEVGIRHGMVNLGGISRLLARMQMVIRGVSEYVIHAAKMAFYKRWKCVRARLPVVVIMSVVLH